MREIRAANGLPEVASCTPFCVVGVSRKCQPTPKNCEYYVPEPIMTCWSSSAGNSTMELP